LMVFALAGDSTTTSFLAISLVFTKIGVKVMTHRPRFQQIRYHYPISRTKPASSRNSRRYTAFKAKKLSKTLI